MEVGLANKELLQGQDIVATRMFDGTNLTKSMSITLHGRIIDKERERERDFIVIDKKKKKEER